MLHSANSFAASDCRDAYELPALKAGNRREPFPGALAGADALSEMPSRYGERRGVNVSALALTIFLHVAIIAVLLGVRQHVVQRDEERLISINLTPPPPPPPAQEAPQPEQKKQSISAPRPLLQINPPQQPSIPVVTDPEPVPPSVQPPVPSPGPPAPPSVIQGGDLGARMVSGQPPRYPMESRRKREQGTVVLSLVLGVNGAVEQISVSRSSGFERLDKAALDAVRKWQWEPLRRDGQPVKVRGIVEIPFVLQG